MDLSVIPEDIYAQIMTSPELSVLKLIQFPLPLLLLSRDLPTILPATNSFFDNQPPNITDITDIQALPSPPRSIINALKKYLPHAIGAGSQSIKPIHTISSGTYPLWIVMYWDNMFKVWQAQGAWTRAVHNLHKLSRKWVAKGKRESAQVVDQVFNALL